jgi:indolepyruvate ferredoxin oxidoreductase
MDLVLAALAADSNPARYQLALQLARIPEQIKGFGHVKARNLKTEQHNQRLLLAQWRDPQAAAKAA